MTNYADPKNEKYPLDTDSEIRSAWSFIHMERDRKKYSRAEIAAILAKIEAAWRQKIDPKGPPSASANAPHFKTAVSDQSDGAGEDDPDYAPMCVKHF